MYAIETKALTKKYGPRLAVDHLDLQVERGKVFGFLGKNGAGKSTLINMITGLVQPTSGSFELLGESGNGGKAIYKRVGVLPEYSTFYGDMSAHAHLKYFAHIMGLPWSREDTMNILWQVGLEDAANMKTKKFSFGMKKKLGIAQAILNRPEVIFLDEPTSGVDANAILGIHELIGKIASLGTTVFLTSHNLDEVEKICDEVAIMNQGTLQVKGSMEYLRSKYQENLTIYIKHDPLLKEREETLQQKLMPMVTDMTRNMTGTELTVDAEEKIPHINRVFLDFDIDVYRLEVDEPSLEEIFLHM